MAQIKAVNAATRINILGINLIGDEAHTGTATTNCTIPWLQDTVAAQVWASWGGSARRTFILDEFNILRAVWNHDTNPLAVADDSNWNLLKAQLRQLAGEPQTSP